MEKKQIPRSRVHSPQSSLEESSMEETSKEEISKKEEIAKKEIPKIFFDAEEKQRNLELIAKKVSQCTRCKLAKTRQKTVFGEGNPNADLLFIGEGPGREEDISGRPFIGRSGQFLTRMIENGIKVPRNHVYITNIVKCRPTVDLAFKKDRPPDKEELGVCHPYLLKQIEIIQPKVIVAVGGPASKFLLSTNLGITRLRGKWHKFQDILVMPIYHPSYILRNGGDKSPLKKDLWNDMKLVIDKLGWKRDP